MWPRVCVRVSVSNTVSIPPAWRCFVSNNTLPVHSSSSTIYSYTTSRGRSPSDFYFHRSVFIRYTIVLLQFNTKQTLHLMCFIRYSVHSITYTYVQSNLANSKTSLFRMNYCIPNWRGSIVCIV